MTENKNIPLKRRASHPAKQNLPGLMGRRDAAWDQAVKMTLSPDLENGSSAERAQIYGCVLELLGIACKDTASVLKLLSSPDTENREKKLFSLQEITLSMAEALSKLNSLEQELFGANTIWANFNAAADEAESRNNIQKLHETKEMLLNQLRNTLNNVKFRIERYRSYTANSFSVAYAERYRNAYSNYRKLYAEKYPC